MCMVEACSLVLVICMNCSTAIVLVQLSIIIRCPMSSSTRMSQVVSGRLVRKVSLGHHDGRLSER